MSAPIPVPSPLPQELLDAIIDEVQYDFSTLISLNNASRCCARARIYLYRAIDLREPSRAMQFFHLCATNNQIKSCVRSIYIETWTVVDYTEFHHILEDLTEVRDLTISGEYECIPPGLRGVFMSYNLSTLTLQEMEFDYADLQTFVKPYPNLRWFRAYDVSLSEEEQVAPNAAETGLRSLESLSLSQTDFFTKAVKRTDHGIPFILANIRRLFLRDTMDNLNDLQRVLNVVHQPLKELYLSEPSILFGGADVPTLDLTKISTLTLEVAVADGPGAIQWLIYHFSSRPLDKVCTTEINFVLTVTEEWHDEMNHDPVQADFRRRQFQAAWDALEVLLIVHPMPTVEGVRIIMSNQYNMRKSDFIVIARALSEAWLQSPLRRLANAGRTLIKVGVIFREVEKQPIVPRSDGTYAWEESLA
ncbi:uncharacterized protein BT62DRAFT_933046 [Guyanagaster necrorhizus]|uniref:F-box domain-containing protein n=1 Tax=Guyanagaster necrorhizus TaxID=856835 RepID=A0A9P8ARL6_9AGAR|nr:uncharacterized protein BT62DRAFT_933046 [Guyanagaster necrorhizus MCA 3950]KAG7445235.1 hypothetical protein BT62DRAFT_933046 [Guyanagaster necrorhizus MCA 3950]